ncbi:MAG: 4'-phosphopantetheinyl transferase superfamily protein [Myxococcota bacterium]
MQLAPDIRALFPPGVAVEEARPSEVTDPIFPEEEEAIVRAVEKRRREYIAGRVCAHRAMRTLGLEPVPVVREEDRSPRWPPNLRGTISHSSDYAVAVVGRASDVAGLGIDVEPREGIGPDLFERICTTRELTMLEALSDSSRGIEARVIFSAKEAFYKCQYAQSGQYLGFQDVELTLGATEFTATLLRPAGPFPTGHEFSGGILRSEAMIVTTMALLPADVPGEDS